jgi:regulator of sigma E protease
VTGFAFTWQSVGGIVLMLLVVISLHEAGHFAVAKWAGIQVDEFSIGFGPRLASRTRGETRYSLRLLPFGGYVRMAGMTGLEDPAASGGPRAFLKASRPRRAAVLAAGGITNLLLAGLLFTAVAAAGGPSPQVQQGGGLAAAGAPAAGYQITGVDGTTTTSLVRIRDLIQAAGGRPVRVEMRPWGGGAPRTYRVTPELHWVGLQAHSPVPLEAEVIAIDGRAIPLTPPARMASSVPGSGALLVTYLSGKERRTVLVPRSQLQVEWQVGYLASAGNPLLPGLGDAPMPWYQALAVGFWTVPQEIGATFVNLWTLVTPHHNPNLQLTGPVGIAQETSIAAQISLSVYATLLGLISLNLGLFNLLPIPFLDGGRLFFILLETARRRQVSPRLEAAVHTVGLALLVMLFIYVTFGDISRLTR